MGLPFILGNNILFAESCLAILPPHHVIFLESGKQVHVPIERWTSESILSLGYAFAAHPPPPSITEFIQRHLQVPEFSTTQESLNIKLSDSIQFENLTPEYESKFRSLIDDYQDVFSLNEFDLGVARGYSHHIELKEDAEPIIAKRRPIPQKHLEATIKTIKKLESIGVVKRLDDPKSFISNLHVIPKPQSKGSGEVRVTLDIRTLNHFSKRLPAPSSSLESIWPIFRGAKFLLSLDVRAAFFQIALDDESVQHTAFWSPDPKDPGCLAFTQAVMGHSQSTTALARVIGKMVRKLKQVIAWVDDILLWAFSQEDFFQVFKSLLMKLREVGLKCKPPKIIGQSEIEFLGMRISPCHVHITDKRKQSIIEYPVPTTKKAVRRFLGMLSFISRFLLDFSVTTDPLRELASHSGKFRWEAIHQSAFESCKRMVINAIDRYIPSGSEPLHLWVDGSRSGIGAVLMAETSHGQEIITTFAKTFQPYEARASSFDRESMALLYSMLALKHYVTSAPKLTVHIDAKALVHTALSRHGNDAVFRRAVAISGFAADYKHDPGDQNEFADALSRCHDNANDEDDIKPLSKAESLKLVGRLCLPEGHLFTTEEVQQLLASGPLPSTRATQKTRRAKSCPRTVTQTRIAGAPEATNPKRPTPPDVKLAQQIGSDRLNALRWQNGTQTSHLSQVRRPRARHRQTLLVTTRKRSYSSISPGAVPAVASAPPSHSQETELVSDLFVNVTKHVCLMKGGMSPEDLSTLQEEDPFLRELKEKLPKGFGVTKEGVLFKRVKSWEAPAIPVCLENDIIQDVHGLSHRVKAHMMRRLQRVYIPNVSNKVDSLINSCSLCATMSRKKIAKPTRGTNLAPAAPRVQVHFDLMNEISADDPKSAAIFVDAFSHLITVVPVAGKDKQNVIDSIRNYICTQGVFWLLRADNEPALHSAVAKKFFEQNGIHYIPTNPDRHSANGLAESRVNWVKRALSVAGRSKEQHWVEVLPEIISEINDTPVSSSGRTPEEVHFGFSIRRTSDLLQLMPTRMSEEERSELRLMLTKENIVTKKAALERFNRHRKTADFKVGDCVLYRNHALHNRGRQLTAPRFRGPAIIISINHDGHSLSIKDLSTGIEKFVHDCDIIRFQPLPHITLDHVRRSVTRTFP